MTTIDISSNASPQPPENSGIAAALWACQECQVWWGSQVEDHEDAHYLLRLAQPYTTLFEWSDYRGWRIQAAEANLCPQCHNRVATPRFTLGA